MNYLLIRASKSFLNSFCYSHFQYIASLASDQLFLKIVLNYYQHFGAIPFDTKKVFLFYFLNLQIASVKMHVNITRPIIYLYYTLVSFPGDLI